MLFSAFWFTFFFCKFIWMNWEERLCDVSWICNLFYFVWGKTTHFNLRRDEWDDVQKAYQIISFFFGVWFMFETFQESMFYVQNLRGKWK